MKFLLSAIIILFSIALHAQEDTNENLKVIQLSGMVLTGDSLDAVQFTTIYRERDKRGTISDLEGFFSISAYEGDTINFRNVGFFSSQYVIPTGLEGNRYSMVQMMVRDTILIQTAKVYPWPNNPNKFKHEVLSMELPENQDNFLTYNYSALYNYDGMIDVESDKAGSYAVVMNQHYSDLYFAGQNQISGLFNPIAWAKFIRSVKNGELKKQ